jgi:LmbE family N-acetylglucosaminyl deacetylase
MLAVAEDWDRVLAVAAHPDDLEYDGVASALARWTGQGKRLVELLVTRGEAGIDGLVPGEAGRVREEEQRASARLVGAKAVQFLDYPDGTVQYGLPLRRDLARAIRIWRPDVVVSVNFRDAWPRGRSFNHPDHRALGPALLDAVRDAANPWVFPELAAAGLDAWKGVRFVLFGNSPAAEHFVDIADQLEVGAASLAAHAVYLKHLSMDHDPAAYLRREAELAGGLAGVPHAVCFELLTV